MIDEDEQLLGCAKVNERIWGGGEVGGGIGLMGG